MAVSDWNVGDLAVGVDDFTPPRNTQFPPIGTLLTMGAAYRIASVHRSCIGVCGIEPWKFEYHRFRKIRPDEREACEPEFVTLLKRSRKTVRA